jgi:hypothetical protein
MSPFRHLSGWFRRQRSPDVKTDPQTPLRGEAAREYVHQLLDERMQGSLRKVENGGVVSRDLTSIALTLLRRNIDQIAVDFSSLPQRSGPLRRNFGDPISGMLLAVTYLPCSPQQARAYLLRISSEAGLGYIDLWSKTVIQDWPDNQLNNYCHTIICSDGANAALYTCFGDYGGGPRVPRKYSYLPVDLLNAKERSLAGL